MLALHIGYSLGFFCLLTPVDQRFCTLQLPLLLKGTLVSPPDKFVPIQSNSCSKKTDLGLNISLLREKTPFLYTISLSSMHMGIKLIRYLKSFKVSGTSKMVGWHTASPIVAGVGAH
ncbi:hypothetical protein MKW98_013083, partial [Papaver atlanticum]